MLFAYFFLGQAPAVKPEWGVNFSQKHAEALGLDWKEAYLALLQDLKVKNMKTAAHWDIIEPEKGKFTFEDIDWQMKEAQRNNAKVVLVVGMKTPRWPECHIPSWAQGLSKEEQQEAILNMLREVVERYRNSETLFMWQVENEPFFPFGECPWRDSEFLREEVDLVKSLDKNHPVMITESGEGSFWFSAATYGDVVGTTLYRKVWFKELKTYLSYPFPPVFYWRKTKLVDLIFDKEVMDVELQAEPWGPKLLYDISLEEQAKTMDAEQFKKNIEYAKKTGFDYHYLWGAEWWYWLKEIQQQPEIWNEARILFQSFEK